MTNDSIAKPSQPHAFTEALTAATRLGPQAQNMLRAVFDAHDAQAQPPATATQRKDIAHFRGQMPESLYLSVDHDRFWGSGFGQIRDVRDISCRWMRRMASLTLPAQLQVGSQLVLEGPARARSIAARHIRLFLDDQPLALDSRFSLDGAWKIRTTLTEMPRQDRPFNILYITSEKSTWRREQGERVVLALHALEVLKRA